MTDTTAPQPDEATANATTEAADAAKSGIHQLYLAALGFPLALADGVGHVFKEAVKHGEAVEPKSAEALKSFTKGVGKVIDAPVQGTRDAVKDLGDRLRKGANRGTEFVDDRLAAGLEKLGVPTRERLDELSERVEALAAQVAELKAPRED